MPTVRPRTATDLLSLAGRPLSAAAAAALAAAFAAPALAQPAPQPAPPIAPAPGSPAAETPDEPRVRNPLTPAPRSPGDPDAPKVSVSEHMTVDLHVKDEDLTDVLELLSIQSQKNIVTSKSVSAKVTAALYGVTFYEALDAILHVNGFGYIEQGNFIYVYTIDELVKIQQALNKRVAKVIRLEYLNAEDAAAFIDPLLSEGGQVKTSAKSEAFAISDDAPVGKDDYALGALLVVIDFEENIEAVEALIREIDTRPAQVLVEATILQTSLNEANAFGVDFSVIGDLNFSDFLGAGGPLGAANSLVTGAVTPADNQGTAVTSSPGNTDGPSTFKVGVIADDISVFLRMLDEVTDTTILSNPKILALNRAPSRVLVGRRVGYLNTTSTDTATTQTVEFLDTGTQLYFRPFVSNDGAIRMELKPQVSEAIIREATDATGAAVSIPDEVTQELTTNVIVRDGQTIILGGLFRESTQFTRRQVPFLGDIPIVGAAFRGHDDNTQRSEIIFMITPTIVTDSVVAETAERAMQDAERVRAGTRQGLLPWSREKMTASLNVEAEQYAREGNYEKANWCLQRSLSLNPLQPDALRLRERITGEREVWPGRSMLRHAFDEELTGRVHEISPSPEPLPHLKPDRSTEIPLQPVDLSEPVSAMDDAGAAPEGMMGEPADDADQPDAQAAAEPWFDQPGVTDDMAIDNGFDGEAVAMNNPPAPDPTPNPAFDPANPAPAVSGDEMNNPAPSGNAGPTPEAVPVEDPELTAARTAIAVLLPTLRGQIDLFRAANDGVSPTLGDGEAGGWSPLIDARLVRTPPANVWVGGETGKMIVVGDSPDNAYHTDYGWIFDPETGSLWAAACDADGNPHPKPVAQSMHDELDLPGVERSDDATNAAVTDPGDTSRPGFRGFFSPFRGFFRPADTASPMAGVPTDADGQ